MIGSAALATPSATYSTIRQALRRRQQIVFTYHGKPRAACPIVLGYSADGSEALSAYQVAGESSGRRALPGWRCFRLAEIGDLETRDGEWREGDSHKQPQACVRFVDVDVNIPQTLARSEPLPFGSPDLRPPRDER
jgi:predicted DNA-binding transcriptional regulator YafY